MKERIIAFVGRHRRWLAPLAGALLFAFALTVRIFWWPNTFADPDKRSIIVSAGTPFAQVLDSLEANGIITSRWSIKIADRVMDVSKSIMVGKYVFESGVSNQKILASLRDGSARVLIAVPIPEGARLRSIAGRYARHIDADSARFMALCTDSAFIRSLGLDVSTLEGYLLPDTYRFQWQTDEPTVIRDIVGAFKTFYSDSMVERQNQMRMSMHQIITMASIVEGESRKDEERAVIAGVYYNRLHKRMRLEADPTIQYIIPNGPRRITYQDLEIQSPYNTYRRYGLPPGPVNNPGRQAILAALYPEQHAYLFFVADGFGGHIFTRTFSEHQKAVRDFRRVRRLQQQAAALESTGPSSR
jgi:UPF0755 protein